MSLNNIKILVIHKAGSVLQKILSEQINSIFREDTCVCSRLKIASNINKEDIVILRHPLNKLISEYYSYGWSHTTILYTEKQTRQREKIRKQSLDEYVIERQERIDYLYNKAFNEAKTIIKYEDIMDRPQQYIQYLLKKLNKEKFFDDIWNILKHQFEFDGKDLSEDIIIEKSKSHRRNLDHLEYQKKISPETLKQLDHQTIETVNIYNSLPSII